MDIPSTIASVRWEGGVEGYLILLDQTLLPREIRRIPCRDTASIWEAIRSMRVRGAPAIAIAAAYGVCVAASEKPTATPEALIEHCHQAIDYLATSRPTAVNLFWALERMRGSLDRCKGHEDATIREVLLREARAIHDEDRRSCHAIGRHGASLLSDSARILTHCNTGGLATSEYGTALSVIFTAQDLGKEVHVFVDETRPLLQGARLTAWELQQRAIPYTLICDSLAAVLMKQQRIDVVITGADRIAANGDTANKIGTYGLAVLARAHGIPFYVAAPTTSFDPDITSGDKIPIEERAATEITHGFGLQTAPDGAHVYNPAFDVTPANLIQAIITEYGCIEPVNRETIAALIGTNVRREF